MHTLTRDYVNVHELRDAESVLAQRGGWIDDYNREAPRSSSGCGARQTNARWRQRAANLRPIYPAKHGYIALPSAM